MGAVEYEQLRLAEEIGRLGSFARNMENDTVEWSIGLRRLLYLEDDVKPSIALWMQMVDSEYRDYAIARGKETPFLVKQRTIEYPMVPFEGSKRIWLRIRSRTVLLDSRPTSVGVAYDITEQIIHREEVKALNELLLASNHELADTVQLLNLERSFPKT